jgi:hypothetical protein
MKVARNETIQFKMSEYIQQIPDEVILRVNVSTLGSPRQVSRGLQALVQEGILTKLGYGTYAKLTRSERLKEPFLKEGFSIIAKEALDKLNVTWEPSQAEQEYNAGLSTQIPITTKVKLKSRFNRKLSYKGIPLQFE